MKKILLFIGVLFFLIPSQCLFAQDGFSKTYRYVVNDFTNVHLIPNLTYDSISNVIYFPLNSLMKTKEGTLIKYSVLTKIDTNGVILKQRIDTISNHHTPYDKVIVSLDKQCLYWAGTSSIINFTDSTTSDYFLTKTDMNLNVIWKKIIHSPGVRNVAINGIVEDEHNDLIIVGNESNVYSNSLPNLKPRSRIFKIDSSGNLIWSKTLGDTLFNNISNGNFPCALSQNENGEFIIPGYIKENNTTGLKPIILKADANGNELWNHAYMSDYFMANFYSHVKLNTFDESYINVGTAKKYNNQPDGVAFANRVDYNGNEIWRKVFDAEISSYFDASSTIKGNSDVILAGNYKSSFYPGTSSRPIIKGYIVKIDTLGNEIWDRKFSHISNENLDNHIFDMITLPSGSIIAVGEALESGSGVNFGRGWVLKLNKNGCLFDDCRDVLGVENVAKDKNTLIVYPNPTSGRFTIYQENMFAKGTQISILDIMGRLIKQLPSPENRNLMEYDISDLSPNLYLIQIQNGENKIQKKLNLLY